jgi:hypothetical protein
VTPSAGGLSQRRARPRPNDCTLPAAASESSARCAVRWLPPNASARFGRKGRGIDRAKGTLGLGDDAPGAGHGLLRTEGTHGPPQQELRSNEITELRHRNASDRKRRRVIAQRDPLQRTQGITDCECTRRGIDQ